MIQISPANPTENSTDAEQSSTLTSGSYPLVTMTKSGCLFTNIVITGLPDPESCREDIEKILHKIRHYSTHGDSSGRRSSIAKIKRGEPVENNSFRLAITYYYLPCPSGQLAIQITHNSGTQALILNEKPVRNQPIIKTEANDNNILDANCQSFIDSALDPDTASFRRHVATTFGRAHYKRHEAADIPRPAALSDREMTPSEVEGYFDHLTDICFKQISSYIAQTFPPQADEFLQKLGS